MSAIRRIEGTAISTPKIIPISGEWIVFSKVNAFIYARFDDGDLLIVRQRAKYRVPFSKVALSSAVGQICNYEIYYGDHGCDLEMGSTVDDITDLVPNDDVVILPGTSSPVWTNGYGVPQIRRIFLALPATAANSVRVGDSTVSAARGLEIVPGAPPLALFAKGDIFAFNPGAVNVTLTSSVEL